MESVVGTLLLCGRSPAENIGGRDTDMRSTASNLCRESYISSTLTVAFNEAGISTLKDYIYIYNVLLYENRETYKDVHKKNKT